MTAPALQHFETFLCVAENKGFTAAAKKLGISKAAVSNTIRLLETSLQVPLFIRTTRNIRLTEEGELLFDQCQRLHEELETARDLVSGFNSEPSGTLRIVSTPYAAELDLLNVMQEYMTSFPKVKIELFVEERMPDMAAEKIDIVFGVNWPAHPDTVAKVIGKTRYVLCASPDYLERAGNPEDIKALEQHCYIPHLGRTSENIIADLKKKTKVNLHCQLKINNAKFMKKFALNGCGIVQLHEYMAKNELADGRLVEVLSEHVRSEIPLYMYYQKHRYVQPKVRQFINALMAMKE